ncbi:GHKL domain-containing protein [Companilactobacillus mishanensis]|uniref:Sensor histidine kinase n=1 Tax=Companilactobacillus mishanensis TaxID=2486008 RepID=A0A5P0ZIJ2_9LACO|nr:GHKL domain-containing protein [Companilactobacillus mishanensis]MQS52926.1 sensor histidine kinase [Companilactobacillus mishanensis]
MKKEKIDISFECHYPFSNFELDEIDFVRLLSIFLDNATEACHEVTHPNVEVLFLTSNNDISIRISNSVKQKYEKFEDMQKPGVSTKKNHSGYGLSIVEDIKKKYNNLFINYGFSDGKFVSNIIVEKRKK